MEANVKLWAGIFGAWILFSGALVLFDSKNVDAHKPPKDPRKNLIELAEDIAISAVEAGTSMTAAELVAYSVAVSEGIYGHEWQ
jgi:hypothetical protein